MTEKKEKCSACFWRRLSSLCIITGAFLSYGTAEAATLNLSPTSGSYSVGHSFSVSIVASSPDQAMNAAEGTLSFPADKLQVVSLSKESSIIGLWAQEPSFSNGAGTVNFEGVILNPGFTGIAGRILKVNFKVKTAGAAPLSFPSGSILANDGKGTNILTDLGSASFTFPGATPIPTPTPPSPSGPVNTRPSSAVPATPEITSETHPDPSKWYKGKDVRFAWKIPQDVTAVATLMSRSANAEPRVVYSPVISDKTVTDLEDGVWYFHVQFKNGSGWGSIAHFRVQVDTTPPDSFSITFPHGVKSEDPNPTILFSTTDTLSGITGYRIKVGDGDFTPVERADNSDSYALPLQAPGQNVVTVEAYDAVGNVRTAEKSFTVVPIAPPEIISYQEELEAGRTLTIKGKVVPNATVTVLLKNESGVVTTQEAKGNSAGNFSLIWPKKIPEGTYTFTAQATNERQAKSLETIVFSLTSLPSAALKIDGVTVNYATFGIIVTLALTGLLFICWYLWHRFILFRKKLIIEIKEAETSLHKAFDLLRDDIEAEMRSLEKASTKRELTREEESILKKFKKNLNDAEKFVSKEIKDIEDEVS